jgi:tRNA(Arg) A34 adenosine deaminase TadA
MLSKSLDCDVRRLRPADRRLFLKRFVGVGGIAGLYGLFRTPAAFGDAAGKNLPENAKSKAFMTRAEAMKRLAVEAGDQPYGAIIVKDGEIVGEGPSRVVTQGDPTAHAEIEAIRDAARRLGTRDLSGCVMYGTSRPCRMCETAAYWANVSRFVHGAGLVDGGAPTYSSC